MIAQKRGTLPISIIMLLFLFLGCNLKEDSLSNKKNTGDVALKINWERKLMSYSQGDTFPFDCETDGVETIEISIYDKNNQEIGEKKPYSFLNKIGSDHQSDHSLFYETNNKLSKNMD